MKIMNIFFCVVVEFIFYTTAAKLPLLNPIRHEARVTDVHVTFNKSFFEYLIIDYKQFYDIQYFQLHSMAVSKVFPYRMRVEVIKCKEHFIDCANHRSFDITNICDKVEVVMLFAVIDYKNQEVKCPLKGEYILKNMTLSSKSYSTLFAPTESWWKNAYNLLIEVFDEMNSQLGSFSTSFYYLTYRSKKN
ncbi:uncharacterized protein LOC126898393 [Daktulosphaira vitifoliae]|uniref:uncharacterized protein LOC126898393 n=1 Tax=Daktulosphaira vitifoliae TaxID=58002 RepID=UPI0021AA7DD5|nr:uncharacterized protein LOC126898393 [Daktulosphaira vitifoliae]